MSLKTSAKRVGSLRMLAFQATLPTRSFTSSPLLASKDPKPQDPKQQSKKALDQTSPKSDNEPSNPDKLKSVSQADKELRERLEQMSGEGGAAGIEYEDGKPNAMKRGVRNNMFRLI